MYTNSIIFFGQNRKSAQNIPLVIVHRAEFVCYVLTFAHFDDILSGAIQYTAQTVKDNLAASRAKRAARPAENGTHAGPAAVVKSDVSKLSKADMEEIDRRVLRGERISF